MKLDYENDYANELREWLQSAGELKIKQGKNTKNLEKL